MEEIEKTKTILNKGQSEIKVYQRHLQLDAE